MSYFYPWLGGKHHLLNTILQRLYPHTIYVEPFLGSGAVFLGKVPAKREVLNDRNSEIVTLWRVIQSHHEEFCRCYSGMINSREEFERFKLIPPQTLTDVQRAVRFFFLMRLSYGGKPQHSYAFATKPGSQPRVTLEQVSGILDQVRARLKTPHLVIENRDWRWLIERCDDPDAMYFLDPPYWGVEDYYGRQMFSQEDLRELAERLEALKGKFLLTLNDTPEVRDIFSLFHLEETEVPYSVGNRHGSCKRTKELLISNYIPLLPEDARA